MRDVEVSEMGSAQGQGDFSSPLPRVAAVSAGCAACSCPAGKIALSCPSKLGVKEPATFSHQHHSFP